MYDQARQADPDNIRAEYAALIAYHNSIVTHRFTLLGFFAASVAFIAKSGMDISQACLLLFLTIALYMVERRNRDLYTQMSKRAMEIEQNHWGLNRSGPTDKTVPLFCRFRLNELSGPLQAELPTAQREELKSLNSHRRLTASHSRGLDLFYLTICVYALAWIIVQIVPNVGMSWQRVVIPIVTGLGGWLIGRYVTPAAKHLPKSEVGQQVPGEMSGNGIAGGGCHSAEEGATKPSLQSGQTPK